MNTNILVAEKGGPWAPLLDPPLIHTYIQTDRRTHTHTHTNQKQAVHLVVFLHFQDTHLLSFVNHFYDFNTQLGTEQEEKQLVHSIQQLEEVTPEPLVKFLQITLNNLCTLLVRPTINESSKWVNFFPFLKYLPIQPILCTLFVCVCLKFLLCLSFSQSLSSLSISSSVSSLHHHHYLLLLLLLFSWGTEVSVCFAGSCNQDGSQSASTNWQTWPQHHPLLVCSVCLLRSWRTLQCSWIWCASLHCIAITWVISFRRRCFKKVINF